MSKKSEKKEFYVAPFFFKLSIVCQPSFNNPKCLSGHVSETQYIFCKKNGRNNCFIVEFLIFYFCSYRPSVILHVVDK